MPRIIVKCRYYQNAASGNLGGLMRYIATREGVDKLPKEHRPLPATENQQQFIAQIVSRNSAVRTIPEYKEYMKTKTRGNASELISSVVENNPRLLNTEEYLRYMALRPRAEKISGEHGLFSSEDNIDLENAISELENHHGNVYSVIVSLKREDAERLGFNAAERWRCKIGGIIDRIAKEHNIPITSLRWYGAFHNESHHPHIHLLLYSTAEKDRSFISKKGIDNLRRILGTEIFKDDLREIYDRQTDVRNKLTAEMRSEFKSIIDKVIAGDVFDHTLFVKLEELARRLNGCSGKKQYGYLPKGVKALVDELVDIIANNTTVDRLYELWYQAKCSVFATYTDQLPERLPLSQEKEFKAIRNALVYEAARLGYELSKSETDSPRKHFKENRENKNGGTYHKPKVISAAMRFGRSLARIFEDNFKKYDPEDDDIDRQLRREIQAVKNGQNLVM